MELVITTPFMHNDNVRKVQTHLKQDGYLQGPIDGTFGPDTSRAVFRAKFWMGYEKPDHMAGDLFYSYLTGSRIPTAAMDALAHKRKAAKPSTPVRLKMLQEAHKWIGVKEAPPDTNKVRFSAWYGVTGPWCAMFVTYCGTAVGAKAFVRGSRWAYVPYMVADARKGSNLIAITYEPKQGDLVTFDWDKDKLSDHVGFFDHWTDNAKTKFRTVEGNTAHGNDSNGGEVMVRDRDKSDVLAFIHVGA